MLLNIMFTDLFYSSSVLGVLKVIWWFSMSGGSS